MVHKEILEYVQNGLAVGAPPDTIRHTLESVGWSSVEVEEALRDATKNERAIALRKVRLLVLHLPLPIKRWILVALAAVLLNLFGYVVHRVWDDNRSFPVSSAQVASYEECLNSLPPDDVCSALNSLTHGGRKLRNYASPLLKEDLTTFTNYISRKSEIIIDAASWSQQSNSQATIDITVTQPKGEGTPHRIMFVLIDDKWKIDGKVSQLF